MIDFFSRYFDEWKVQHSFEIEMLCNIHL